MYKTDTQSYDTFVPKELLYTFELDMEKGEYKKWLEEYPSHKYGILAALISTRCDVPITTFEKFISLGVNINETFPQLQTTPMRYACEHRLEDLLVTLIKVGAQPENGCLVSLFEGHSRDSVHADRATIVLKMSKILNLKITPNIFPVHFIQEFRYENDEILEMMCKSEGIDYQKLQKKFEASTIDVFLNDSIDDSDYTAFIFGLQKIRGDFPESIVSNVACIEDSRFLQSAILFEGDESEFFGVPLWNSVICGKRANYEILKHTLPFLMFEDDNQEQRFLKAVKAL
jgi:hypothetical protein